MRVLQAGFKQIHVNGIQSKQQSVLRKQNILVNTLTINTATLWLKTVTDYQRGVYITLGVKSWKFLFVKLCLTEFYFTCAFSCFAAEAERNDQK